jgi:hypothetical protein
LGDEFVLAIIDTIAAAGERCETSMTLIPDSGPLIVFLAHRADQKMLLASPPERPAPAVGLTQKLSSQNHQRSMTMTAPAGDRSDFGILDLALTRLVPQLYRGFDQMVHRGHMRL